MASATRVAVNPARSELNAIKPSVVLRVGVAALEGVGIAVARRVGGDVGGIVVWVGGGGGLVIVRVTLARDPGD
jgi:hypothetical protein